MKDQAQRSYSLFPPTVYAFNGMLTVCLWLLGTLLAAPVVADEPQLSRPGVQSESLEQLSRTLFDRRQFTDAVSVLEQVAKSYDAKGDRIGQAIAFSNLSLVYEQLGQWPQANTAISTSLNLLQANEQGQDVGFLGVLAQVLDIQGQLQFAQGQAQQAFVSWEQADAIFSKIQVPIRATQSRINQARALQSLGLYRRAISMLKAIASSFPQQQQSQEQMIALRSLGDALRVGGELQQSRTVLEQSLAIAKHLQRPEAAGAAHLSLGKTLQVLEELEQAQLQFAQALETLAPGLVRIQAQLNQLSLAIEAEQWSTAQALWPQTQQDLQQQPPHRSTVQAYLNLAGSLIQLRKLRPAIAPSARKIAQLLVVARQQAQSLGDGQSESYAVGTLGTLYEQEQQWSIAEALTQQAIVLANNTPEGAFRWQWQLGRLLKQKGDRKGAITAYSSAVETLQTLRQDLVAINPEVRFSFRDSVEPIYRQLVALLLDTESPENLETARLTIEALQLAELDNFFREACLNASPVLIDEIDQQAAVIYPIILPKRLAVIVSLPGRGLKLHVTEVVQKQVEFAVYRFRLALGQPNSQRVMPSAQQLYDWLLRPIASELAESDVETLVFVQDGVLRNIPMAALHDGSQYVVEQYAVALTPGLQLLDPKSLRSNRPKVLAAGLSKARGNFSALPHVLSEVDNISQRFKGRSLLNERFTRSGFQTTLGRETFPVVHLATHGQFSSQLDETFLLTWEDRINANQLREILQTDELKSGGIELLVLSACETAMGDDRAALGLAGIATRSGARSTLATLWQVNDEATAALINRFYQILARGNSTKASALQEAQKMMLQDSEKHQKPYYWSPYVLVGGWL